jgi:hypothetical protein
MRHKEEKEDLEVQEFKKYYNKRNDISFKRLICVIILNRNIVR